MTATGKTPAPNKRLGKGAKYSRSDVLKLKEFFDRHDLNHNGRVTVGELIRSLERQNSHLVHQALSTFKTVDLNKNMVLTFDEYLRRIYPDASDRERQVMLAWAAGAAVSPSGPPAEPLFEPDARQLFEIQKMFDRYDSNRNGVIEIPELVTMSAQFGYDQEEISDLFLKTDKNMNGSISFDEFVHLMRVSYI